MTTLTKDVYTFSKISKERILTCHHDIQLILSEVIKIYDISVLEGYRDVKRQQELFNSKPPRTKKDGIIKLSMHNYHPSMAVDICPYKKGCDPFEKTIKNLARFYYMMGIVKAVSEYLLIRGDISHRVRFGLDWDSDDIFTDQSFDDLPHIELRRN